MAGEIRFAVIKKSDKSYVEVVPGYNDEQFLPRLVAKLNEKFLLKENYWKRRFMRQSCLKMLAEAFKDCIEEIKKETIHLA